ncbi:PaaX family transcriptional regulator C-terminal domain-containing protein [Streptomyces sp. NPDC059262]|uniref:PaaX family transcriptional regulator C-terminal domain-containing protein n=1 Tax=Streptomyces sp. NPDC059262 TaxID=3346797 RepID=UPI0036BDF9AC
MPARPEHSRTVSGVSGGAAARHASKGSCAAGSTHTCAPRRSVRESHERFVARFADLRAAENASGDAAAFVARTRLMHAWRGTFERNPRLPGAAAGRLAGPRRDPAVRRRVAGAAAARRPLPGAASPGIGPRTACRPWRPPNSSAWRKTFIPPVTDRSG